VSALSRRALCALAAVVALTAAGCAARYTGGARRVAPEDIRGGDGWTVAPATPVRQARAADCGAAALAMVVARWRPALDRAAIERAVVTHLAGQRLGDLRDVARATGLRAFALAGDRELLRYELSRGRPVVVGLYRPYTGERVLSHYEVVVALHRDGRVATIDPSDATWRVRTWDGLLAEWQPAGRPALVVLGARAR
jgi:ABC-type bacteriocin/lantibiotic exporter with double-glycine peptidase domain